jgi:DNA-binding ferritin-like protein
MTHVADSLSFILGSLRAIAGVAQSAHWQAYGSNYYSDHLLFERIYKTADADVDALAEKIVGYARRPDCVDARVQALLVAKITETIVKTSTGEERLLTPEEHVLCLLSAEEALVDLIWDACEHVEYSPGVENLLQGIADKHEQSIYLLRQRSTLSQPLTPQEIYSPPMAVPQPEDVAKAVGYGPGGQNTYVKTTNPNVESPAQPTRQRYRSPA